MVSPAGHDGVGVGAELGTRPAGSGSVVFLFLFLPSIETFCFSVFGSIYRSIESRDPRDQSFRKSPRLAQTQIPISNLCTNPLALDDAHLLPSPAPAAALVSRVLASHPGPFRAVRIAEIPIDESNEEALLHLADKGVEDLTSPWSTAPTPSTCPCSYPQPSSAAGPRSVAPPPLPRRLALPLHHRPPARPRRLPPPPGARPLPRQHGGERPRLCARLQPQAGGPGAHLQLRYPDRVRLGSRSLRCVLLWHSLADEVAAVSAPNLQRLIIYCTHPTEDDRVIKVKIGHAPQLAVLGYLDTATHELEIGNTFIKVVQFS
ncbi:hypothetical protein VPH35_115468 [Triticum aestivum]